MRGPGRPPSSPGWVASAKRSAFSYAPTARSSDPAATSDRCQKSPPSTPKTGQGGRTGPGRVVCDGRRGPCVRQLLARANKVPRFAIDDEGGDGAGSKHRRRGSGEAGCRKGQRHQQRSDEPSCRCAHSRPTLLTPRVRYERTSTPRRREDAERRRALQGLGSPRIATHPTPGLCRHRLARRSHGGMA